MPRKAAVASAVTAATVPARGRAKGAKKAAPVETVSETTVHVECPPCPICCEPRDSTDMKFYPCPCGFQLCLFCYKRLKNEFSDQCPACRAPYEVDPEDCKRIVASRAVESSKAAADGGPSPATSLQQRESAYTHVYPSPDTVRLQPPPPPPPPKQEPQGQRKALEAQPPRHEPLPEHNADFVLPSGTTWATPHLSRANTQDAESAVDDAAWPSLAESVPAPAPAPTRQASVSGHDVQLTRQFSSASADTSETQHTLQPSSTPQQQHQQHYQQHRQQHQQQPPLAASTAQPIFHTAQVTSMVSGIKRAVCVPLELPPNGAEPVPEAAAVLPNVKAAVREGRISSTDGAHQLVSILRQCEKNRPSQLQAGRLPPGFADASYRLPAQPAAAEDVKHSGPQLQQTIRLGGTVVDYPLDRSTLHSPFQHTAGSLSSTNLAAVPALAPSPAAPAANRHAAACAQADDAATTGRSLWQSNGLPGLDLSSTLRPAVPFNVSAIWGNSHDPSSSLSGAAGMGVQELSKPPPPGFGGPVLQQNGKLAHGANGYHPPLAAQDSSGRQWLHAHSFGQGMAAQYTPPVMGAAVSARPPAPYRPLDFQPQIGIKSDFSRAPGSKT